MFNAASSPGQNGFATPVRAPSTSYHGSEYSQALASTPDSSASKGVRFQNQPLPAQTVQSSSAVATSATPDRSRYYNAASASASGLQTQTQTQTQTQSPQQRAAAAAAPASSAASSMAGSRAVVSTPTIGGGVSSIALSRRIKWNVGALAVLWIVPALTSRPRDVYWAVLDQIYMHAGGEADEIVDGVVGWMLWAVSVVLLFNVVEAAVLMRRASQPSSSQSAVPEFKAGTLKPTPVLGMHSPQVAKSINFVAASRLKGSPKTRTSNIGAGSPISHPHHSRQPSRGSPSAAATPASPSTVDYAQFSPTLRRTWSAIPTPPTTTNTFANAPRSTTPCSTIGVEYGTATNSSPLAAFRARHASRNSPSPSSLRTRSVTPSTSTSPDFDLSSDLLIDANDAADFLGDESFEVDRALKSLRGSFGGVSSTPAPFC